jgi:anti-sigma regulatory factor (Ser/Thr protein kinase)
VRGEFTVAEYVCETMTAPLTGESEWWFTQHPASVAAARRMLRYFLSVRDADHYRDAAELVVSELMSNAVEHATKQNIALSDREICARFDLGPTGLRIEVSDPDGDRLPRRREPDEADESGRGLAVLDALVTRWGAEPCHDGTGKTVWALLRPEQQAR